MADSRSRHIYDPPHGPGEADGDQRRSDPLAELARLIGQDDPFADFERRRALGETQGHAAAPEAYPPQEHAGQYAAEGDPRYQGCEYPADPYQEGYQPYYDPYYDPEAGLDEAEYLEQQDRKRRRRRIALVTAVLAVLLVGGAGAYGFFTFLGPASQDAPPPVIKADTTPTKVIPAAQAADAGSNKLIYDRVGESGSGQVEKIVPREEEPVEIKTATVSQPPRIVYPAKVVAASPTATIPITRQSPSNQVLPIASEPSGVIQGSGAILPTAKKVRTLTIRPDMTIVRDEAARTPEPEPPALASAEPAPAPAPAQPKQTAAPAAPTPAPARVAAAPPPPQQSAGAPLSLSPDAVASPPSPQPRATTPAAGQPMALASAPAPASSRRPAANGGGFTVQVSSQRSEAEAEAAYRTLQARYPNVLGGQPSFVRRADLGSRGIYYRTLVGPFATAELAGQLCASLKAAGGQCIIHRN